MKTKTLFGEDGFYLETMTGPAWYSYNGQISVKGESRETLNSELSVVRLVTGAVVVNYYGHDFVTEDETLRKLLELDINPLDEVPPLEPDEVEKLANEVEEKVKKPQKKKDMLDMD